MHKKTKQRIRETLRLIGVAFITAAFAFTMYLTIGLYGKARFMDGARAFEHHQEQQKQVKPCSERASLEVDYLAKSTDSMH